MTVVAPEYFSGLVEQSSSRLTIHDLRSLFCNIALITSSTSHIAPDTDSGGSYFCHDIATIRMSEPQQLPWHALLRRSRDHHLVNVLSMRYLVIVPVLLAITTAVVLFIHSDVNVAMLYSQCHARARLPWISHMPLLGAPACFLVSFFGEALASVRAFAIMSVVLSFIASLLTVSTVEAARICNGPSLLIAYPTGPWLVFNLMGGAMVWELLITPAFFHRSKQLLEARERAASEGDSGAGTKVLRYLYRRGLRRGVIWLSCPRSWQFRSP